MFCFYFDQRLTNSFSLCQDVDAAVVAAQAAFEEWSLLGGIERGRVLTAAGLKIRVGGWKEQGDGKVSPRPLYALFIATLQLATHWASTNS
jgi:hypothetical protein